MAIQTSYTEARANLAALLNRVTADRETVIIRRRGADDAVLISAAELAGLVETAHVLRSPKNAERLLAALDRAEALAGESQSIADLRRELGLGPEA